MRPIVLTLTACLALPAHGLELELTGFYDLNRPASLDYDPAFCGLWIANEGREVVLVTLDGLELRRFASDLSRIKAITVEGGNLLVADGFGRFQRLTKDGVPVGAPFQGPDSYADTEGMVTLADGTIITVEDDPARITWMTPGGEITKRIDGHSYEPMMTEPQGIAVDPRNGHLLIVDDWEGTNSLFELDAEGKLLGTHPLIAYGTDPEGIAIRPGSDQVFMAFDQGARIASFAYTPTPVAGEQPLPPGADCMMF
ncbi:MAG: hypothetical protein AAFX00_11985 [Pseudomonadota bacterium]